MTQTKMAKLIADLERAEAKLARAFTKWVKLRAQVKRAGAKLDKDLSGGETLPGKLDIREMGIAPKPWPARKK
jgi:hypothetical protein